MFGRDSIAQLGALIERRKWQRVLVITDQKLRSAGLLDRILQPLTKSSIHADIFDGGEPEPSVRAAQQAIDAARRCQPQAIIGLGGGSNMDLAKFAACVIAHGGAPQDYFGFDQVPGPVLPLICVPTTAGTGSEVSHAAVLTDTENHVKVSTLSNYLRPAIAIVDPALTDGCPRQVTADSGIDALTHAIEGYTATDYDKMQLQPGESIGYEGSFALADCIAEKAIELISQHLVMAVQQPDNRAARDGMALAATLAGLAFSNAGVALVHALEYPLGGALHCSHGAGNGLLLPFVMQFNLPQRKRKFVRIAELLGENVQGKSEESAAQQAIRAVERLRAAIGIPQRIRDIGGNEAQLPQFATKAYAIRRLRLVNPRMASEDELLGIYKNAF